MINLKDLQPIKEMPENLIKVPTFIEGILGEAFFPKYEEQGEGNRAFAFNGKDSKGILKGSNPPILGLANKILFPNFRTPVPTDDIYETIYPMIKGNFYTDLNALDVWESKPDYKQNTEIWKQVIELAEQKQGKLKFPFRIQGFYCVLDKSKKSYEARIEPAKNFRIIEDERLNFPTETKFNSLDELGMINPCDDGKFTKYNLGNGVSRVFLYWDGDLDSSDDYLAYSDDDGRVVVVDAEGVGQKFSAEKYKKIIQQTYKCKIDAAEKIKTEAFSALEKL